MGHRIEMMSRMQRGEPAWPAWGDTRRLLRDGLITFAGMIEYHTPAVLAGVAGWWMKSWVLDAIAMVLWIAGVIAIPGYMTHYCFTRDPREIFNPWRALRRVFEGGGAYLHAWLIAFTALSISLLFLAGAAAASWALGPGIARYVMAAMGLTAFFAVSVWFWQVAGFAFATVFTRRFRLEAAAAEDKSAASGSP